MNAMGGLVVKPRAWILHGHDWVFSGEVLKVFGNAAEVQIRLLLSRNFSAAC